MSLTITSVARDCRPDDGIDFIFVNTAEEIPIDTFVAINSERVSPQHIYNIVDGGDGKIIGFGTQANWSFGDPFTLVNSTGEQVVQDYVVPV